MTDALGPLKHVRTDVLEIGCHESGPADGPPVVLLHGFPYDVHAYAEVAPALAARGCRVLVPYLRGHGATRFLDEATPRSGQQAAIGADVLGLLDALGIPRAILAGYDWGGRAACVAAALWPARCAGLVSVNGYLIQDIAHAARPIAPEREATLWYQYYLHGERGRAGLAANRRALTRLLWSTWSPGWRFDDATFERSAAAFDHRDWVDIVVHSYRHRHGLAPGDPRYAELERRLADRPAIAAPAITLDGADDRVALPSDGESDAAHFAQRRAHRIIAGAGHDLPQEAPAAFAQAVLELLGDRASPAGPGLSRA
jgi:pimeloyl-ACP methyl ester carboxylesterase